MIVMSLLPLVPAAGERACFLTLKLRMSLNLYYKRGWSDMEEESLKEIESPSPTGDWVDKASLVIHSNDLFGEDRPFENGPIGLKDPYGYKPGRKNNKAHEKNRSGYRRRAA